MHQEKPAIRHSLISKPANRPVGASQQTLWRVLIAQSKLLRPLHHAESYY
jgi:hypothetical protein